MENSKDRIYILENDLRELHKSSPEIGRILIPQIIGFICSGEVTLMGEKAIKGFIASVENDNLHYVDGVSFQEIDSFIVEEFQNEDKIHVACVRYCDGMMELCEHIAQIFSVNW